jgi:hypothetical protein
MMPARPAAPPPHRAPPRRSPAGVAPPRGRAGAVRRGIEFLLAGLACKAVLDLTYLAVIAEPFAYAGLGARVNEAKVIESYLVVGLLSLAIPRLRPRPSSSLLAICFFLSIVPLMTIYACQDRPRPFTYVALLAFLAAMLLPQLPRLRLTVVRLPSQAFVAINAALVLVVAAWIVLRNGLAFFNLDLFAVYEYRAAVGEALFVGPFVYLIPWTVKAFNPLLFLWSLERRNWLLLAASVTFQLFFFSTLSGKDVLFGLPFILLIYAAARARPDMIGVGVALVGVMALGALERLAIGTDGVNFLLTRRVLLLPAMLAYQYHDVFAQLGHTYWSQGLLGAFLPYPFPDDPQRLVGAFLYGHEETWANNGMFGAGFMNLGFAGMLLYGALLGGWLYLADCLTVGRLPRWVTVAALAVPVSNVTTDGDLVTGLITHGGVACTLMLWLWAGAVAAERRPSLSARPAWHRSSAPAGGAG